MPQRIGRVLSKAAAQDPTSPVVCMAVELLAKLFMCAPHGAVAAAAPAVKSDIWQQLQQSGTMQAMPRVVQAMSTQLGDTLNSSAAVSADATTSLSTPAVADSG